MPQAGLQGTANLLTGGSPRRHRPGRRGLRSGCCARFATTPQPPLSPRLPAEQQSASLLLLAHRSRIYGAPHRGPRDVQTLKRRPEGHGRCPQKRSPCRPHTSCSPRGNTSVCDVHRGAFLPCQNLLLFITSHPPLMRTRHWSDRRPLQRDLRPSVPTRHDAALHPPRGAAPREVRRLLPTKRPRTRRFRRRFLLASKAERETSRSRS